MFIDDEEFGLNDIPDLISEGNDDIAFSICKENEVNICSYCDGTGEEYIYDPDIDGPGFYDECKFCKGTGYVD